MFQLLLFLTLPMIFVMSVSTILLYLWLARAIREDVQETLVCLIEAHQEGRQKLAKEISTPGGNRTCLECKTPLYEINVNSDGSPHVCENQ